MGELMLNAKFVYTDGGFHLDPRGSDLDATLGHEVGNDQKNINDGARMEGSTQNYMTNRNTIDVSADGNYFAEGILGGDHEIKFGVDYYTGDTTTQTYLPNQRVLNIYGWFRKELYRAPARPVPRCKLQENFRLHPGHHYLWKTDSRFRFTV
jgi:hypothetical protein